MTEVVEIGCGARLHLGFLDLHGGLGRRFGSLGLALDAPQTRLVLRRAAADRIAGPERARAGRYLADIAAALGLPGGHALAIEAAMPAHAGLGSGTQLALAVATAARRLHGLPDDPAADAARLGRGTRSGIGIALFAAGGCVLDGGRGARDAPPPCLARLAVPAEWRVLLLLDPARAGVSGAAERAAFAALPAMPEPVAGALCRLVLMQALPALAEADLPGFGNAVTRLQQAVGDYFAPAQGGRFASPLVAGALERLERLGAHGLGQSSWGPSGFAFAADPDQAAWLAAHLAAAGGMPEVAICRPRNCGASIAVRPDGRGLSADDAD
jgi:beta-RFAP synthase